jgi:hypothetical protein
MTEKSTEQLLEMFCHSDDWLPEALHAAEAELQRRGVDAPVVRTAPVVPRCRGAYSLNGVGTIFYGQRDFRYDGSYLTTEWLVVFYLPIIPIRSLRVRHQGPGESGLLIGVGSAENYAVLDQSRPNLKQVVSTYGYVGFVTVWCCLCGSVAVSFFPQALNSVFGVAVLLAACLTPVPTPWILRHYARMTR